MYRATDAAAQRKPRSSLRRYWQRPLGDWREIIATYYGMVSRTDAHFGRVMRAVQRSGTAENTVTAVTTDHGEYLGDYGPVDKYPSGLNDCLTRNPLMIGGPGLHTGARSDALVELVDVLPTLLLEPICYPFYRNKVLQQREDPDSVGRRLRVLFHRHDRHPRPVLNRPGNAQRDVQPRRDRHPGLSKR